MLQTRSSFSSNSTSYYKRFIPLLILLHFASRHIIYPFIATFNIMEHPQNMVAPVITAINMSFLQQPLLFFLSQS